MKEPNRAHYGPGAAGGYYESFFQRANHPERPLAFWIRYTTFCPRGRPDAAIGELWAVWFDGESGRHLAVRQELPLSECELSRERFAVRLGSARLGPGELDGQAASGSHSILWSLRYQGGGEPLLLLPPRLYGARLPRAKALVPSPGAVFEGTLVVDDLGQQIDGWVGSQNHNWGSRHTDRYAWGQVAGFDDAPESFLEVASGSLRFGPLWTPLMTLLVLRHQGREYRFNQLRQLIRARAWIDYFRWHFETRARDGVRLRGVIQAPPEHFVGLRYRNPPGGEKHCLNSKLASCVLELAHPDGRREELTTRHRAAFEILTDDTGHGIPIRA